VRALDPDYAEDYEHAMAFFYRALLDLNMNIYAVERVLAFPLHVFTEGAAE
jgi:hypothetical protein